MKCGTAILSGQVFCEECLADMELHPVKPDTPVILPRREKQAAQKRGRKRLRKPEDIISRLRRTVWLLMVVVAALVIALTITVHLLVTQTDHTDPGNLPGQNYGTSEAVE